MYSCQNPKEVYQPPWVSFCKISGLNKLFPSYPHFNGYHLGYLQNNENHVVDILAGAFMWIRKSTLEKVGLLDEKFFMYGEDIDLLSNTKSRF